MKKRILLMLPMCMVVLFAVCQNKIVTGVVTDDKGLPVEAASVTIQGTRMGTSTDQFGNYRLANVPPNATLQVSGSNVFSKSTSVDKAGNVNIVIQRNINPEIDIVTVGALGLRTKPRVAATARSNVSQAQLLNGHVPVGCTKAFTPYSGIPMMITGIVTDDKGLPLSDVSVRIASTNASTGTDSLGRYKIYAASDTCTLLFEAFGAWPMKENIKGRSVINFSIVYPDPAYGYFLPEENKKLIVDKPKLAATAHR